MPLYAYRCTNCGHQFEKIQSFSAEPESVCPECGGKLVRPLTAPAFNFKGAGWYVNDYASRPSASSESNGTASSASNGTTESKPETKPVTESKPATPAPTPSSTPSTS